MWAVKSNIVIAPYDDRFQTVDVVFTRSFVPQKIGRHILLIGNAQKA